MPTGRVLPARRAGKRLEQERVAGDGKHAEPERRTASLERETAQIARERPRVEETDPLPSSGPPADAFV
jgi:hypothetical protein